MQTDTVARLNEIANQAAASVADAKEEVTDPNSKRDLAEAEALLSKAQDLINQVARGNQDA